MKPLLALASLASVLFLAGCSSQTAMLPAGHGMTMSMEDMTRTLKGKTGDDFDRAFIEAMIPHHEGAIEMAREAKHSAKHEEIRAMADDIIAAQQREIDTMRGWMREWGYTD